MTHESIPAVDFDIDGDYINIEQDTNGDGCWSVRLHRMHIQHIASKLGIPVLDATATTIKRRFETVTDKLFKTIGSAEFRSNLVDSCPDWERHIANIDIVLALADEFLDDLDAMSASEPVAASNAGSVASARGKGRSGEQKTLL